MHLSFNKTSEEWKTWEFKINGSYPESNYDWLETEGKEISKIVIYARAYKDAEGTKWNQCYKETKPSFSENTVSYGIKGSENENEETKSKGTPGFEFMAIAISIAIAIAIKRRK